MPSISKFPTVRTQQESKNNNEDGSLPDAKLAYRGSDTHPRFQVPKRLNRCGQQSMSILWDLLLSPGGCTTRWQVRWGPVRKSLERGHLTTSNMSRPKTLSYELPRHRDSCHATCSLLSALRENHHLHFLQCSNPPLFERPSAWPEHVSEEATPTDTWCGISNYKSRDGSMKRDEAKRQNSF